MVNPRFIIHHYEFQILLISVKHIPDRLGHQAGPVVGIGVIAPTVGALILSIIFPTSVHTSHTTAQR